MADTAAALVIQLSADFKDFKKQMQAATGVFDAEARKIERKQAQLKKTLETGFGKFGTVLSAAAVIGFGRSILNTADALSDASQQLGITTQQLQGLDYAARVSGASSEKLVQALSFLSDGLGEAQRGEGNLAKFMRENNVAMGTTVEVLYDVADRVKNATTQTEKMNIATTALGAKGGKSMVSFLNQGADGLRRLQAEAGKKGQIWDADTIAKLDSAKDSFATLEKALVNVAALPASAFINDLAGLLNAIGDGKVIEGLKKLGYIMPVVAGVGIGARFGGLAGAAAGGAAGLGASYGLHKLLDAPASAAGAATGGTRRAGVPAPPADRAKAERDAAKALADAVNVSELLARAGEDAKQSTDAVKQSTRDLITTQSAGLLARSQGWVDHAAIQKDVINETAKLDVMAIEERKLSDLRALDVRAQEERNRLADLNATLSDREEFEAAYLRQRVNLEQQASLEIKTIHQRESDDLKLIRDREIEVSDAFRSSLIDIGSAALHGFGSMKDAAASALDMIAQMILQMYVLEPLVRDLFGEKGTKGGGFIGGLVSSLFGFADGGVMTPGGPRQLKRYAGGGTSGTAAIFGEAGPEAAVPLPDGRRIPVELRLPKMPTWGGSGGGVTVTQNFDLSGAVMTDELFNRVEEKARQQANIAVAHYDRAALPHRVRTLSGDPRRNY